MAAILNYMFSVLLALLVLGTLLVILDSNADSEKKIAWILVIAIIPIVGLVLYVVFGLDMRRPGNFRQRHHVFFEAFDRDCPKGIRDRLFDSSPEDKVREEYRELARLLSVGNGTTVMGGNDLEVITSGHRKLEALLDDIASAKDHIHMEYFYFRKGEGSDRIKHLLMQKAREGVKVRFIHENIANIDISPSYYNEMKEAGVEVVKFVNPKYSLLRISAQLNYRNHRKIVVIDGRIGYVGGMNIGDDYFKRWRDTHIRLTGNAVAGLQYSFMNSFITSGGRMEDDYQVYFPSGIGVAADRAVQIVPDEPTSQWPILQIGMVWALQHAGRYAYIQTPYFVPPEPLMLALKSAALKGADVRLMLPEKPDSAYMGFANRSYYKEILEAGVKIYEKTGEFIHSKTFVSDDYLSIIGSANMDYRSMELNYEINSYIYDSEIASGNREIFMRDLASCNEITLDSWLQRPWYMKVVQSLIKLFSPLL